MKAEQSADFEESIIEFRVTKGYGRCIFLEEVYDNFLFPNGSVVGYLPQLTRIERYKPVEPVQNSDTFWSRVKSLTRDAHPLNSRNLLASSHNT